MTARRLCRPLLIVLTTALVTPACYTLLKHPRVNTAAYEEVQTNPCTSCHDADEVWRFHHPSGHRLYPETDDDEWGFYYAVPWWYDSYWYYDPSDSSPLRSLGPKPWVDERLIDGTTGGPIGFPPDSKSTGGSVRTKNPDDSRKGKTDEEKREGPDIRSKNKRDRDEDKDKDQKKDRKNKKEKDKEDG